jgi:hypothetical protein
MGDPSLPEQTTENGEPNTEVSALAPVEGQGQVGANPFEPPTSMILIMWAADFRQFRGGRLKPVPRDYLLARM